MDGRDDIDDIISGPCGSRHGRCGSEGIGFRSSIARRLANVSWWLIIAAGVSRAAGAQIPPTVPVPSIPSTSWVAQDIGNPAASGWSVPNSDRFVIPASGQDIAGARDQFRFVYQILAGDVQIKARLDSFASTGMQSRAGLMIRSSLEAGAAHGSVLVSADGVLAFHGRQQDGAGATTPSGNTPSVPPQWMALERAGARVVAYSSPDGNTWTAVGSEEIALGETVYIGIAVTGAVTGNVAVTGSVAVQGPIADMSHVAISGLPPWQRQHDIGEPVIRGRAWRTQGTHTTQGTYTMTGAGAIEEARDQFNFVYQPMQGDVDVVARVASLPAGNQNAKAGVMIRESLAAESRHAFALVAVGNGYAFDRRDQAGESSEHTDGGPGSAPGWVRLVRRGNDIEAFRSNDGLAWTSMGSTELVTDGQVFVGLAVTSQDSGAETTAVFDAVNIAPAAGAPTQAPTVTSPSAEDTGIATTAVSDGVSATSGLLPNVPPVVALTSPLPGAAFTAPATITLTALATDLEGRLTQVRFYANSNLIGTVSASPYTYTWSSAAAGSYTLTAVAADADGGTTTSLAVPITVAPSPNQLPSVTLTSPASGAAFTAPATISLTATASDPENELTQVEFYRGSTLIGSDTTSPYGFTWSSAPAGSYTLTAVATDTDGGTTTSAAVSITVAPPPNQLPSVTLTSPASGATFTAPATVSLTAAASDPENELTRVEFYRGSTLIGTDTTSPYGFTWSSAPAGSYTLTAVATDADGGTATSAAVSITVTSPPNQLPSVTLTSPASGATFTAPATISLTATASDPENELTRVEFYRGSTLLGSDTTSPYGFTWSSAPAGSYTLTAVATDADGGTATSAAVSITVTSPPNQLPSVTLTSPASGATFTAPATISLTATASDPENELTRVEFYRGSTLLGSDTTSPYGFTWSSAPAGSYTLTAVATDADGGTRTSAAVTITVNAAPSPAPSRVIVTASTDHDTKVTSYRLEVFTSGTDPETGSPSASSDLGKPTPDANRDITVDRAAFFGALSPGNYTATVSAIGPGGSARSAPVAFTR